ncbi:MAG: CSLREA domain-containing protein, partial [Chloroflexi bacterium]|nr:CSLREA domain-containing protein [Chloroflexota bacterium]
MADHNWFTLRLSLAIVLALFVALAAGGSPASAANITVNTTDDELNADNDCSLREAITAANTDAAVDACTAGSGPDTIDLPAGTYTLSIAGNDEDAAATGDLDITDDLTLAGADAATTTVDAAGLDRVFDVMGSITVEIRQITVTGGVAGPSTSRNGGGIQNSDATLTVEYVVITGNATGNFNGASGGGLVNVDSGVVTINSSTIDNNTAPNLNNTGAGVANTESGVMTINDSTISDNTALQDGGGVHNANVGFLTINNSVISGNEGRFGGGFSHGNGATAIINDSTITGNLAIDGGGVEN